jgi:3'(2'), 5'-bisphosphate nucleotidase
MTTRNIAASLPQIEALVRAAGPIVRTYHDRTDDITWKGADDPVTAADRAVNHFLVAALRRAFPADGILAEESQDDDARLELERVWCIDPLDGTKEFIARNGEFSIMVGLAIAGEAVLGVVYQPIQDLMYSGVRGVGAWMTTPAGRQRLTVSTIAEPAAMRLVVSRSHRNPITDALKEALGMTQERISGSVGLKCGLIARGEADLYLHPAPGLKEWDTCAPEAILVGAGGRLTDCWGRPLRYNRPDVVRHNGLVASNGRCHDHVIARMAPVLAAAGLEPDRAW